MSSPAFASRRRAIRQPFDGPFRHGVFDFMGAECLAFAEHDTRTFRTHRRTYSCTCSQSPPAQALSKGWTSLSNSSIDISPEYFSPLMKKVGVASTLNLVEPRSRSC